MLQKGSEYQILTYQIPSFFCGSYVCLIHKDNMRVGVYLNNLQRKFQENFKLFNCKTSILDFFLFYFSPFFLRQGIFFPSEFICLFPNPLSDKMECLNKMYTLSFITFLITHLFVQPFNCIFYPELLLPLFWQSLEIPNFAHLKSSFITWIICVSFINRKYFTLQHVFPSDHSFHSKCKENILRRITVLNLMLVSDTVTEGCAFILKWLFVISIVLILFLADCLPVPVLCMFILHIWI